MLRRVGRPKAGANVDNINISGSGGTDPAYLAARLRRDPEALAKFREEMKHQGERTDLVSIRNEVDMPRPAGTTRAYSIARVQRECDPETVAAVMAGGDGEGQGRKAD